MRNYDSVIAQLTGFGLEVGHLEVGRLTRCKCLGDRGRQRTGWYSVFQMQLDDGDQLLVGAYGSWREGADPETGKPVAHRIRVAGQGYTPEQRAAFKARILEDRKIAEGARKREAERAAVGAQRAWKMLLLEGASDYLKRKRVGAHGVRFSARGNLAIPIMDTAGKMHGLQIIYGDPKVKDRRGRDKDFYPPGLAKRGHFHLLGMPTSLVLVAEGYATAASIYEATGHPVAVAFDAGNLVPVCQALHKRFPSAKVLVCADDDFKTPGNPGQTAGEAAAVAVKGAWVVPVFADRGDQKLTDFNDLAVAEGALVVRAQLAQKLSELGWVQAEPGATGTATKGGGEVDGGKFHFDLDGLLRDFTLIYGTDTVFDDRHKRIILLGPLRSAAGKSLVREWLEHPGRQTVLPEQVVFDPACSADAATTRNLWGGWPTVPRSGSCELLLDLLRVLCGNEPENTERVFDWVLKWLAYPIQHPGAKMQTALLMHGPEGRGKNTFFGCIRDIYGKYGTQFSQSELESQFNGWAAGKLFAIGNEVVSRVELYHVQGRLKNMVTEHEWQINDKHLPTRAEANHCNFVFFSNRVDIAKLDRDDRRYCVVWTPPKLSERFYADIQAEIRAGGVAALHDHLLHLDLAGFSVHTKPPVTQAKAQLIDLGQDSTERFWNTWIAGDIAVPVLPCLFDDLYQVYRTWCGRVGVPKYAPSHVLRANLEKKYGSLKQRAAWTDRLGARHQNPVVVPDWSQKPPDKTESQWLSPCIEEFRDAVDHYRQAQFRGASTFETAA